MKNFHLDDMLFGCFIGSIISILITGTLMDCKEKNLKDEAVRRGYAQYATDGRAINFVWKD